MSDKAVHCHVHSEFCLAPDTRVVTSDLRWVPIRDVEIGDELVGFDEDLSGSKMKRTVVESKRTLTMPSYEIVMGDGTSMVASSLHLWVVAGAGGEFAPGYARTPDGKRETHSNRRKWCKTEDLIPGVHKIVKWASPWGPLPDESAYDAGYLSAMLDGEGWIAANSGEIGIAQNEGPLGS